MSEGPRNSFQLLLVPIESNIDLREPDGEVVSVLPVLLPPANLLALIMLELAL